MSIGSPDIVPTMKYGIGFQATGFPIMLHWVAKANQFANVTLGWDCCAAITWNSQRRTHKISNGEVIWDFAGNPYEWVTDHNFVAAGQEGFVSTWPTGEKPQRRYGADPATLCATPSDSPYCGMGIARMDKSGAGIRGGAWGSEDQTGILSVDLDLSATTVSTHAGFRCVFNP